MDCDRDVGQVDAGLGGDVIVLVLTQIMSSSSLSSSSSCCVIALSLLLLPLSSSAVENPLRGRNCMKGPRCQEQ